MVVQFDSQTIYQHVRLARGSPLRRFGLYEEGRKTIVLQSNADVKDDGLCNNPSDEGIIEQLSERLIK